MDRLDILASVVPKCKTLIDVGCDHGKLSKLLLDNNLVDKIYCSDISELSLNKARLLLKNYDNVEFLVGDGLKVLKNPVDVVVIAGMGGANIIDIINQATFKPKYILSPHKNADDVRRFIIKNGYKISKDFKIFDKGKFYDILLCEIGDMQLNKFQIELGVYYKIKNEFLYRFLLQRFNKISKYPQNDVNLEKLSIIKEGLKWQQ